MSGILRETGIFYQLMLCNQVGKKSGGFAETVVMNGKQGYKVELVVEDALFVQKLEKRHNV